MDVQVNGDLYIGLMSGTSLDGVDAVLASFADETGRMTLHGHCHRPIPAALKQALNELNTCGTDELHRAALASNALSRLYSETVVELLASTGHANTSVRAIGAHGQTVRHQPGAFDGTGYTIQLMNGSLLAELCGIGVVCDFRGRDIAAGGQGAPLVPGFHAGIFAEDGLSQAILNLGGIANLTLLGADGSILGFDCGPANTLMDIWCESHLGRSFDEGGEWAATGCVDNTLLVKMLAEPYFSRLPPKSTGKDLFSAYWLAEKMHELPTTDVAAADVQATLVELTAHVAVEALVKHQPDTARLLVCGGGALNKTLMARLGTLSNLPTTKTDKFGISAMQVEAAAFAWLAKAHIERIPANCPAVTGAKGKRILGAGYPA